MFTVRGQSVGAEGEGQRQGVSYSNHLTLPVHERTVMFGAVRSRFPPTIRQLLSASHVPQQANAEVCGWVKSVRRQKNVTFAVVSDGSSTRGLQAVFARDVAVPERCAFCLILPQCGVSHVLRAAQINEWMQCAFTRVCCTKSGVWPGQGVSRPRGRSAWRMQS